MSSTDRHLPIRATEHIALVGSGSMGFALTSPYDCNVYLVVSRGDAVLIDAGCGLASNDIASLVATLMEPSVTVSRLFITHSHADHAAGAVGLKEAFGAQVLAPAASAEALRRGDDLASVFAAARQAGSYPADLGYPPVPVDELVCDGDIFAVGDMTIEALAAPGHSYDHTVYLLRGPGSGTVLFAGDLILTDGRVLLQASWDCRLDEYAKTIKRLSQAPVDALMPGHGAFLLKGAGTVLEKARRQFATLVPPPSAP